MSEKLYPLIIWFYHEGERKLFTKISFDHIVEEHPYEEIKRRMAKALQSLYFDIPIEIAIGTQSSSVPTTIELVRVNGVDVHTIEKESAVFALTLVREVRRILDFSEDEIRSLFEKMFSNFRKSHKASLAERRGSLAAEIKRLDKIYGVLDF